MASSDRGGTVTASHTSQPTGRPRPPLLRALGRAEPPEQVEADGSRFHRVTTFKHDSWAATGLYEAESGRQIVCKFNRIQPVFGIPMRWLGRLLAGRERRMLKRLADEPLVPNPCRRLRVEGQSAPNCVAHDFVPGHPLSRRMPLSPEFFPQLEGLLQRVHQRGIAYVDLHKRENILVGSDGRPYLIDFQISQHLPQRGPLGTVLRVLQRCDDYHLSKHIHRNCLDRGGEPGQSRGAARPWVIRAHRQIAVPFRTFRRQLLVWLKVRAPGGRAQTEAEPEVGAIDWPGP
jgi:hypothetical protein